MPIITGVTGYTGLTQQVRLVLEPTAGEQVLMPLTTGASTMSLTTQPNTLSATTGMHLHFYIYGNATAGTITITGTNIAGGALSSITYHVPIAPQNNQGYSEFTTSEVFGTVTASNIVLSTLTPCQVMVWGSYAAKFLLPITSDSEEKITHYSPPDKRGILFKNFRVTQLTKGTDVAKFDADTYADQLWQPYMAIGNTPTITTVPASATTKLASTAIASPMTLTTGPVAPGEFFIFAITGNTASGTIVIGGVDQYGNSYASNETITFTSAATQTVYSARRYSSINTNANGTKTFVTTGGTSSSIAVMGYFASTFTWTYDGLTNLTPYTAGLEVYDGVMGVCLPNFGLTDCLWTWDKQKSIMFTSKGFAQDFCIVGDNAPTSTANYLSGTNPFATIAQPQAQPYTSWPASFYIDSGNGGTSFTTQEGGLLTFKAGITTGRKPWYSGDGQQRWSNVTWDTEPDFTVDGTMVMQTYLYLNNYYKNNTPMLMGVTFQGTLLGMISNVATYETIKFTFPMKFDTVHRDFAKNPVELAFKNISEYSFGSGFAYKVAWTAQLPPTYTA